MEDRKDLVLVEIDSGVEDIKLRYILEREVAEHLRRKQEHPLKNPQRSLGGRSSEMVRIS